MQKVSVENLKPGMIVAKSIFDINGTLLLSSEVMIDEKNINRLKLFNLGSIYIKNPFFTNIDVRLNDDINNVPEIIQEKTRSQAIEIIRDVFQDIPPSLQFETGKVKKLASLLIGEILRNKNSIIHLTDIRTYDGQTFAHSVNVAAIATLIGAQLDYTENELNKLALGALLHDIGKIIIPPSIMLKPGKLTDEEWVIVRQHTDFGFEILRKNPEIPLISAHIAYQHHEKYDGTGYSSSLKGTAIHEYARIVAIADVYEALTSDRCYRKGYLPHEAYEIMLTMSGTHLDYELLTIFLNQIAVYPVGSTVRLSNGMLGVVEKVLPGSQLRPIVRVIAEKIDNSDSNDSFQDNFLENKSYSLDLSWNLNVTIVKVLTEEEVCELMMLYQKKYSSERAS